MDLRFGIFLLIVTVVVPACSFQPRFEIFDTKTVSHERVQTWFFKNDLRGLPYLKTFMTLRIMKAEQ